MDNPATALNPIPPVISPHMEDVPPPPPLPVKPVSPPPPVAPPAPIIPPEMPASPPPPPPKKWGTGALVGSVAAVFLIVASVVTGLTLYQRRNVPIAPTAPASQPQAGTDALCANGSFTTTGGARYCFVATNAIKTVSQAQTACQPYGKLASFLDGDAKADVLEVITRFNLDKIDTYLGVSGGDPDDGAYFADTCNQFTAHYGNNDTSLYWGDPEGSGNLDCSQQPLSFGRSAVNGGRVNDTKDGNGRGAVCELAALASPSPSPSPSPVSSQCQEVKVFKGGVEIETSDIKLNDTIVFRGFASGTTATAPKLRFTLTKGGVAQTPVDKDTTLVGALYQADYPITVDQATSYSATAVAISP